MSGLVNELCVLTPEQGKQILICDNLIQANACAAQFKVDCQAGSCEVFDNGLCEGWGDPVQRPDGKWKIHKNPNRMSGIVGIIDHSEKLYQNIDETQGDKVGVAPI